MKFNFWFLCSSIALSFLPLILAYSSSHTEIVKHTDSLDPDKDGFWTEKKSWKSRWVKYWKPRIIFVPLWKKVWSPIVQKEWVPLPNTPPGWTKPNDNSKITEYEY